MNEEQQQNALVNANLQNAVGQNAESSAKAQAMQFHVEKQEQSLAEAQLECDKTLKKIYHLLRQDFLRPNEKGIMEWKDLKDQKQRVLTDLGVDKLMQVMETYINKETLLSNFDEDTIKKRMLKFCLALNSNFLMKYEIYFRVPTLEDCEIILKDRIKEQKQLKILSLRLLGKEADEEEIEQQLLKQAEKRIEYEMQKIKSEQIKINLREYELLFTQMEALVEATHNRAFRGEERGSLRRHFNISEVIGGGGQAQQKQGGWFGWNKK